MKPNDKINKELTDLKSRELALFNKYNRHANAKFKTDILIELIHVINKIEVLTKISS